MKLKSFLYNLLLAVLLTAFLVSAFYVGRYLIQSRQTKGRYEDLAALMEQGRQETVPSSACDPSSPSEPDTPQTEPAPMLPEFEALYQLNSDIVGWLQIPGTRVNYPVMQTPYRKDYYLRRDFDKISNPRGCLYAREECDIFQPSDNITIYGHRMSDGSMFADLHNYLYSSFWEKYPSLEFSTLTQRNTYDIFAVFTTSADPGKGFAYHDFIDAESPEDFDAFICSCLELALYDTGIVPEYGDKLICLSTCEYTHSNGRLVVAAVRRDGN